jgi:pimeloyl-ACP methyl ester carboxylesterase
MPHSFRPTVASPRRRDFIRSAAAALTFALAVAIFGMSARAADPPGGLPAPLDLPLETRDGVVLRITYYPGNNEKDSAEKKKKTIPIVMLHGLGGQRGEYVSLATDMQSRGHAVVTVDLRGHGGSTRQKIPGRTEDATLKHELFRLADFQAMATFDMEAVKSFLIGKHNDGELNVEQLCVVGAEMGAIIALNWAVVDWSWPVLPGYKQGQDVQALVLVSPDTTFKGMTIRAPVAHDAVRKLSMLVVAGSKDSAALAAAKRVHNTFEKFHTIPTDPKEKVEKQDYFFVTPPTTLQGTTLAGDRTINLSATIADFIEYRLVRKADLRPWRERNRPLGN